MAKDKAISEILSWLRLARSENIGPITFYQLLEHYGTAISALEHLPDLAAKGGRQGKIKICSYENAEQEYLRHCKADAHLVLANDQRYPQALAGLTDAPPVISVLGDLDFLNKKALAIVGARNASLNGKKFAEDLATKLSEQGWIIVSGLARGIDTHAHKGSLSAGTIAVLAGGVDNIYPLENTSLYQTIKNNGTLVSETPYGMTPKSHFFPRRNRIISGLCKGVIVVEAARKSGSLITATCALEQGREVYAVPGSPYDPRHRGCNSLISQGATLVQGVDDILESFHHPKAIKLSQPLEISSKKPIEVTNTQRHQIEENIGTSPVGVDELSRQCHICPEELLCIILELELAGKVRRIPGNKVVLNALN